MRKSAIVLAAVLAASFSTAAVAAKKKAGPPPDPAIQAQANSAALMGALFNPAMSGDGLPAKPAAKKGKAKKKG
jgi:hypothetical protein